MLRIASLFTSPSPLFSWIVFTFTLFFVLNLIYKISIVLGSNENRKNILLLAGTIFISILFIETGVRMSQKQLTHNEMRVGFYEFLHHGSFLDSLHLHFPNKSFTLGNINSFKYPRTSNSLGLTDQNWTEENPDNYPKILCLGDSFTEGDGAPADSTWPILFNQILEKEQINAQILNAGVCGSDPYFELMLLNSKLLSLNPNLVIFSLSMQDFLDDIAVRGGSERFDPKTGKKTKLIEILYAYSHLVRLVMHKLGYNSLLIKQSEYLISDLAKNKVPELVQEFAIAKEKNPKIQFFFFLYPHLHELEMGYNQQISLALEKEFQQYPELNFYNLMSCYKDKIHSDGDLPQNYWWKNDGHHNSKGYYLKARCINEIISSYLVTENEESSF